MEVFRKFLFIASRLSSQPDRLLLARRSNGSGKQNVDNLSVLTFSPRPLEGQVMKKKKHPQLLVDDSIYLLVVRLAVAQNPRTEASKLE